jgi:hypothetical protein
MFDALTRDERLMLLRFVCAFAWTDLEITPRERAFMERLVTRSGSRPTTLRKSRAAYMWHLPIELKLAAWHGNCCHFSVS